MVEPVSAALAGIALVKKSVDFIKSNIQTCQDIGQIIGHVENAMIGEQQCLKARDKKGADPFATENVAQEIIDAKIARENLQQMKNMINLRFGHGTWDEILMERKRRIDAKKQAIKEARAKKMKQQQEIMEIVKWACIGTVVIAFIGIAIYVYLMMNSAKASEIDSCKHYEYDIVRCMNEGSEAVLDNWHIVQCDLDRQQQYYNRSVKCTYEDQTMIIAQNKCPKFISCKDSYTK